MGNIYFTSDLEIQVLKAIKEAYDCADVKNDLDRIRWTIQRGTNEQAGYLDREMRQKYPMIDYMLQVANHFPAQAHSQGYCGKGITESLEKSNLEHDYWGILCDTAVKKKIKETLERCIDRVEDTSMVYQEK